MNDDLKNQLASAWKRAGTELGIRVVTPFKLRSERFGDVSFAALVQDFGSPKGMLIIAGWDKTCIAVAESAGFGFSCLYENSNRFEPELFIDMLNDWGWTCRDETPPKWYRDEPGTNST